MSEVGIHYETVLPGGKHWSFVARRGSGLRLVDLEGGANVGMLLYNPQNPLERYNAPDTLKCQQTFKLTAGHCLYSDMGRIFCSVVGDTVGWHDTVCGTTTKAIVAARWGVESYQDRRNDWTQNGRDSFLVEAAKYGLGRRDLAANVNWFSKAVVDADGRLGFVAGNAAPGSHVDLRFEMDTLVLLHTCPHPLNPAASYPRQPVLVQFRDVAAAGEHDSGAVSRTIASTTCTADEAPDDQAQRARPRFRFLSQDRPGR
jgi:urea carboxylase-associated protein 2